MTQNRSSVATGEEYQRNLQLQAQNHPLVNDRAFTSIETYVNHLIHRKAYEEATRLVAGKAVLDLGCNVGYGIQMMAATASAVSGVDVSPGAVKSAMERLGPGADVRLYDGVRSSFPSHSFDVVTSFQVIEHISDYDAYCNEIVRVLRPGGVGLFTTPNRCLRLDPGMKPWNPFHVREFSGTELRELLLTAFAEVEVRGLFGKPIIYDIERSRVERSRAAARSPWKRIRRSGSGLAKRLVPQLAAFVHRYRMARRNAALPNIGQVNLDQYSTRDLFYKTEDIDDSLDLMAICRLPRG